MRLKSALIAVTTFAAANCLADGLVDCSVEMTANTVDWVGLDGVHRNVELSLTIEWTFLDSVGYCADTLWPHATGTSCHITYHLPGTPIDHIAYTPASGTRGFTNAYPRRLMIEQPVDDTPRHFGERYRSSTLIYENEEENLRIYERYEYVSGNVLISVPCGTWGIYYVADNSVWDYFWATPQGWGRQSYSALLGGDTPSWGLRRSGPDFDLIEFIEENSFDYAYAEVTAVDCGPAPPDADVEISFLGYVNPDGTNGYNWLPTPGDSVGLAFRYHSGVEGSINIRYVVSDITMWAGECMNNPWAAPAPVQSNKIRTPTFSDGREYPYFDAWIGDPENYDLRVYDLGPRESDSSAVNDDWISSSQGDPDYAPNKSVAAILADRTVKGPTAEHVLWIVARDYAMDCSVTPQAYTGVGKTSLMQPYTTEFQDSVYNVTVPRDNDGSDTLLPYFATGDFMADAWEEQAFNYVATPREIRHVIPFADTVYHKDLILSVDCDTIPEGRDIPGDYLANWEEYRGFHVSGDSSAYLDPCTTHVRTDPLRKNIFLCFHRELGRRLSDVLPGFLYSGWQERPESIPEILLVNNFGSIDLKEEDNIRTINRKLNVNSEGSALIYSPNAYPSISGTPAYWRCNAVLFTPLTSWDYDNGSTPVWSGLTYKYNVDFGDTLGGAGIPNSTQRIALNIPRNNAFQFNLRNRLLKGTISHELGHAMGMLHTSNPGGGLMTDSVRTNSLPDTVYIQSSKDQYSIRERRD